MQGSVNAAQGPVVVLGASYAGGWDLNSIAGAPIINRGMSGQQSIEMLERFERDVVAARPRAVVIWGFINDFFRTTPQDAEQTAVRVRDSYKRMIELARRNGIEPIIATEVTIRPPDTWSETLTSWVGSLFGKESYQDRINRYVLAANQELIALAEQERVMMLDFQAALAEKGGRRRREFIQEDGSHVTAAGYAALTSYATRILEGYFGAT